MAAFIFSSSGSLAVGSSVYTDEWLTSPAPDGIYSNGTNTYTVSNGVCVSTGVCSSPTTTSTTTQPIVRQSWLPFALTAVSGPFTANDHLDPYQTTSYADNIANNPDLEVMSYKSAINEVAYGGIQWSITLNGVTIAPDSTTPLGIYNVINSGKEHYNYMKKLINNSFLASRNPVIRMHRGTLNIGGGQIKTFYLLAVDFDYVVGDSFSYNYVPAVGVVHVTPYTIQIPFNRTAEYSALTGANPGSGSWTIGTEQTGADWDPGNVKAGVTIAEKNVTIPSTW